MASYTEWDRLVNLFRAKSPNIAKAFDEAKKHSIRQDKELTALVALVSNPTPPSPGGGTQGTALPARHVEYIQRSYWVDGALGSDATTEATARDSAANPWATIQKAINTFVWPTTGDVSIYVRNGTYQAANNTDDTVLISGKGSSSSRQLIVQAESGQSPLVRLAGGTGGTKRIGFNIADSYVTIRGFEVDSVGQPGPAGGCNSAGVWTKSTSSNVECEKLTVHHIQSPNAPSVSTAQGVLVEGTFHQFIGVKSYANGLLNQGRSFREHGFYLSGSDIWLINCVVYDQPNGRSVQLYSGDLVPSVRVWLTHCTLAYNLIRPHYIYTSGGNDLAIRNSILYSVPSGQYCILLQPNAGGSNHIIDHVLNNPVSGTGPNSHPSDWTVTNQDTTSAPGFVDGPNRDLRLTVSAAARGYTDTAWSPATDILGNPRPADSEDAGAYQYTA